MTNPDSIKSRLRNLAIAENKPYEYLQTHYFIERLLMRLSQSEYAYSFVLKGGLLLYSIFGHQSRATKDLDFLVRNQQNDPVHFIKILSEVCQIDSVDAVQFDTASNYVSVTKSELLRCKLQDACYQAV